MLLCLDPPTTAAPPVPPPKCFPVQHEALQSATMEASILLNYLEGAQEGLGCPAGPPMLQAAPAHALSFCWADQSCCSAYCTTPPLHHAILSLCPLSPRPAGMAPPRELGADGREGRLRNTPAARQAAAAFRPFPAWVHAVPLLTFLEQAVR